MQQQDRQFALEHYRAFVDRLDDAWAGFTSGLELALGNPPLSSPARFAIAEITTLNRLDAVTATSIVSDNATLDTESPADLRSRIERYAGETDERQLLADVIVSHDVLRAALMDAESASIERLERIEWALSDDVSGRYANARKLLNDQLSAQP